MTIADDTSLEGHRSGKDETAADMNNNHKTRHIILVRHNMASTMKPTETIIPSTNWGLSIQARKTGQRLAELNGTELNWTERNGTERNWTRPRIDGISCLGGRRQSLVLRSLDDENVNDDDETQQNSGEQHHDVGQGNGRTTRCGRNATPSPSDHDDSFKSTTRPTRNWTKAYQLPWFPFDLTWYDIAHAEEEIDAHHDLIENAFQTYFYRDTTAGDDDDDDDDDDHIDNTNNNNNNTNTNTDNNPHEFEIIVCHANVIRYFFCRAL
jgi:hypothetical protein